MPQVNVSFIPPLAVVSAEFFTVAHRLEDYREPLKVAVEDVIGPAIRKNFDVGGRPPWEPLQDATLGHTQRVGAEGTLVFTGRLRAVGSSPQVWNVKQDVAELDAGRLGDAYYGAFHQIGYRAVPARPWATLTPEDEAAVQAVVEGYIGGTLSRSGFITSAVGLVGRFLRRFK